VAFVDRLKDLAALIEGRGFEPPRMPPSPDVAVEIAPDRITAVRLGADRKTKAVRVHSVATRSIPEGAIEVALARPNIVAPEPVLSALSQVLGAVGASEQRLSVLLPDHVARVALLPFATLPRTRRELLELVRFRMAKSLPFKVDEAVMDMTVLSSRGGPAGAAVLAVFMHRAVLEQYETLFTSSGYWPGLVGLSTFEIYNLFHRALEAQRVPDKDTLLLNVTPHYLAVLIFRGDELIFYRCKPHASDDEDLIKGVRREIYTSLAFYQEKLMGRGVGRAALRAVSVPSAPLRDGLAAEIGCPVDLIDLTQVVPLGEAVTLDAEGASLAAAAAGAIFGRRA